MARANLRAHLIVRELLSLFAFCPDLIEDDFATSWSAIQLAAPAYPQRYCDRVQGPNVEVPKHLGDRLYSTLARDPAISEKMSTFVVPVRNVIVSKDYVAAMTDDEAEKIHAELISGRTGHD